MTADELKARNEAYEKAAKLAESLTLRKRQVYAGMNNLKLQPCEIADAIRALKDEK